MKRLAAVAALALAFGSAITPAFARESAVIDNAHMLGAGAIARINQKVSDFTALTGKEVVVDTEPSLGGATLTAAAEKIFAQQQVNGVLIYIARDDKKIQLVGDRVSRPFFPAGSFTTIYQAMRPSFAAGNVDEGVNTGVDLVLNQYRSHESSLNRSRGRSTVPAGGAVRSNSSTGGFSMGWILWLIIIAVIIFVIRGIFRAMTGPRMVPPGYGGGGPIQGGPMMGGGYGPGYGGGFGGGGGGFWSGMLGGLGGAFLGNELFGNRGNFGGGGSEAGLVDGGQSQDAGGWQSDAGQADTGNSGGGGWGDSGGGGGDWGGGDSGGGGGGDSGGGW